MLTLRWASICLSVSVPDLPAGPAHHPPAALSTPGARAPRASRGQPFPAPRGSGRSLRTRQPGPRLVPSRRRPTGSAAHRPGRLRVSSESSPLSPPGPSVDPPVTRALGGKAPDPSTVAPARAGPSGGRSPGSQHLCALRGCGREGFVGQVTRHSLERSQLSLLTGLPLSWRDPPRLQVRRRGPSSTPAAWPAFHTAIGAPLHSPQDIRAAPARSRHGSDTMGPRHSPARGRSSSCKWKQPGGAPAHGVVTLGRERGRPCHATPHC